MQDKTKILQELRNRLKESFYDNIKEVILFGSQARNKESKYSDFDVLIVTKNQVNWKVKSDIRDICYDISVDFDILVDSKIISQTEIDNEFWGKHPLITDALNFGIHAK